MHVRTTRGLALVAVAAAAALALSGCAGSAAPKSGDGASVDFKTVKSAKDAGGLEALVAAAEKEGALNVIALPHDWANYGEIIAAFKAKYPKIKMNEITPDASSSEEIKAAEANKGTDQAPDVFDLGATVALASTDYFAPYKVATWADVPDTLKDADGLYVADIGGYVSVGYDSAKYPEPKSLDDLLKPEYKGAVALNGDPMKAGAAIAAVGWASVQSGGTLDDFTPGIDFFAKLNKAGNFVKVQATTATIVQGETPVVINWDYLNATATEKVPTWKTVILPGKGYAGYYFQAINVDAPHPAAARLWQEFLYTDEAQNMWLKGGARPSRGEAMAKAGTIDKALYEKLPAAPTDAVLPTKEQSKKAGETITEKWAAAVQ
ncbi:MAG TPA: ABC transporter substrate-binding protein [Candidatus Lumbricidophila sp.]|nr:ABC transporter substrate-binding protein [Candidatus Lumbricidophila sp.]